MPYLPPSSWKSFGAIFESDCVALFHSLTDAQECYQNLNFGFRKSVSLDITAAVRKNTFVLLAFLGFDVDSAAADFIVLNSACQQQASVALWHLALLEVAWSKIVIEVNSTLLNLASLRRIMVCC